MAKWSSRTLDVSVLVAAGAKVELPVTCVEHGRWDGSRSSEVFAPAPQASYPELRRLKGRAVRETGVAAQAQGEVWAAVAAKSARMGSTSETGALRDAFVAREDAVGRMSRGVRRRDGQLGAVCCINGELIVADLVGRADVFAALHGPLVAGYALDAAEQDHLPLAPSAPPSVEKVQTFLDESVRFALRNARDRRPSPGLGENVSFANARAEGSGLVHDESLVALTAFCGELRRPVVRRPSRRR